MRWVTTVPFYNLLPKQTQSRLYLVNGNGRNLQLNSIGGHQQLEPSSRKRNSALSGRPSELLEIIVGDGWRWRKHNSGPISNGKGSE
ncbi:hypothetical protein KY290_018319 [Solanum tuberosum]|uniref:Uncharacterized protein n=1 Tax=Solanum tuberosum TaxID=4113 RepID=A0ABQ7VFL6_SOLTU|nr:hypothetical protein KY290_018319 [Solanum tuberosum]